MRGRFRKRLSSDSGGDGFVTCVTSGRDKDYCRHTDIKLSWQ
jgi:hypothetical protein